MSKKRTVIELEPEGRIHKETFMTAPDGMSLLQWQRILHGTTPSWCGC